MRGLQPTLRLGRDVWDRDAMPVEEFAARADRLRAAMSARGLDAMLLFGNGLDACGHPTYISNYMVKLPFTALVVLPHVGAPALMFEGATRGRSAAQATTWIEDVRPCWAMAETCLAVLKERNLLHATIGLAAMPRLVPHDEWTTLLAGLRDATLVDAEDLVWDLRAIKSPREVHQIQRASEIVRRALESAAWSPHPTEMSLAARLFRDARKQGAEDIRMTVASLRESDWAFRPPESTAIVDGDRIAVTLCASWARYWAEATRTFTVRGDRLELDDDAMVRARFDAAVHRARPGATIADWADTRLAEAAPNEREALHRCGLGHAIGLDVDEAPILSTGDQSAFAAGMCAVVTAAAPSSDGLALRADTIVI